MQEIHIYRPYRQEMWFSKMAADGWPPPADKEVWFGLVARQLCHVVTAHWQQLL